MFIFKHLYIKYSQKNFLSVIQHKTNIKLVKNKSGARLIYNIHTPQASSSILQLLQDTILLKDNNTNNSIIDNKIDKLCSNYKELNKEEKSIFLSDLCLNYRDECDKIHVAANALMEAQNNPGRLIKAKRHLQQALTPKYRWLFVHIARQQNGVKFLVDMRTDILNLLMESNIQDQVRLHLRQLNVDLKDLLMLWFSVGFLRLERITWNSSCDMMQKISEYEAVHPVRNWTDLKTRVGDDRRCFVYTHSSMPGEPLVVLHTALRSNISTNVSDLIPGKQGITINSSQLPTVAVFYSISATQPGLKGIELGNYLIKRVANEVKTEFPSIIKFSTLSPVPYFRQWLFDQLRKSENQAEVMRELMTAEEAGALQCQLEVSSLPRKLLQLLTTNAWLHVDGLADMLQPILSRLCLRYLCLEKKRGYMLCAVGNFHLRNGAELWRLNWLADTSGRGLAASCGIMVNYRYRLEFTDNNSLDYIQHKRITMSAQIQKQLTTV